MKLYHGSKVAGIKVLKPSEHVVVQNKGIVFATPDKAYALSMVYGTGNDLAVSYSNKNLYIDEIKPGALQLLDRPGSLYELSEKDFELSPEELEGEYISYKPVTVVRETKIPNLLAELKRLGGNMITYEDVPKSMKTRGLKPDKPAHKHNSDRFS